MDGNVERVVARLLAIEEPLRGTKTAIRAAAGALGSDKANYQGVSCGWQRHLAGLERWLLH